MDDIPDKRIVSLSWKREAAVLRLADGETLTIPDAAVLRLSLSAGDDISGDVYDALCHESAVYLARERGLRLLASRALSRAELSRRLCERGAGADIADEVCAYFVRMGLLDDARYAEQTAETLRRRGYGPVRIREELRRRGVDRESAEAAALRHTDDGAAVYAFIQKRARAANTGTREWERRVRDALLRRGFSYEDINTGFRRYYDAAGVRESGACEYFSGIEDD